LRLDGNGQRSRYGQRRGDPSTGAHAQADGVQSASLTRLA
jgi:hypothetical protein